MSFETIIIILQTIGPFTVLVTVYFLVTELKEQNRVARANARQNIADSHQKLTLAGLNKRLIEIKVKLKKGEELTEEEDAAYLTHFTAILRARQSQHYQYTIGMIDKGEWDNYKRSFKTLFKSKYHLKLWSFMKNTFNDSFVEVVEELIADDNN